MTNESVASDTCFFTAQMLVLVLEQVFKNIKATHYMNTGKGFFNKWP